jgi:hypothetical protein
MFKNLNPIWLLLGLGGAGFAVYWFALRPPDDCTDCADQGEPNLSKYREPINSKFRPPSSPSKHVIAEPPSLPPKFPTPKPLQREGHIL